ncbi:Tad domain-containing protein [Kluyvera ascorbata]|uniref:Tad domain-containing protein n=1 Tax=Kluyvera ascorbata TaxID=51288 RepID=A0AB35X407_9ENTR
MKKIGSYPINFFRQYQGAITVSAALMMPMLIGFFSVAVDGARFNSERSRLTDALNQSVYAVAVMDNRNATVADKRDNIDLVSGYLSYYFPTNDVDINDASIEVNAKSIYDDKNVLQAVDYSVNTSQIAHPIFNLQQEGKVGFQKDVTLRGNGLSGSVRRSTVSQSIPTDYAFVVDFSSSMTDASAERGLTREALLKKVVRTLGQKVFALNDGSTIGLVPYSTGVTTILNKSNYVKNNSKEFGCTYAGKMKDKYNDINWDFWYNKPNSKTFARAYTKSSQQTISSFTTLTDDLLKNYYIDIVAAANGYTSDSRATNWLVNEGYCYTSSTNKLICDADSKSSIHNAANSQELQKNFNNYLDVSRSEADYYGIINPTTMDIDGTLSGDYLFNEDNVRTFVAFQNYEVFLDYSSGSKDVTVPFKQACYYAYGDHNGSYSHTSSFYSKAGEVTKPSYYLVDLTDNENVLDEFDDMHPFGNTDSLSGLLRSVPMLAKGMNTRKIIFVITDGLDNKPDFRQELMARHGLCNVIKEGLKKYPDGTPTTDSDIYYISLVKNTSADEWADYCVGSENAFIATNLDSLLEIIGNVMFKNTIEYINPGE